MKRNVVWLAIFSISLFSGICFATDAPEPFVKKNGCPGHQDCRYGNWQTTKEVTIVKSPSNPKVIGKVAPGQTIHVESGDVYITPLRIDVLADHKENVVSANDDQNDSHQDLGFKAGDVLYWMGGGCRSERSDAGVIGLLKCLPFCSLRSSLDLPHAAGVCKANALKFEAMVSNCPASVTRTAPSFQVGGTCPCPEVSST